MNTFRDALCSAALQHTAAGVGDGQPGAFRREHRDGVDGLAAQLHDLHRHRAGHDGGLLQHLVAVQIVLGDAVGLRQWLEALRVRGHLVQQVLLQAVALGLQSDDLGLHVGILLLANGQGAHHVAKRRADGTHQRRRAAAARNRGVGGQHFHKFAAGVLGEILSHNSLLLYWKYG